jgi:hypothetical protein
LLTLLTLDQVSTHWDIIKYAVEQSLPPLTVDHPDRLNRILSSMLKGQTQCWASYTKNGNERRFEGIAVTKIIYDDASNTRNLLLYCLYGYDDITSQSYIDGLTALAKYAEANNCAQAVAYTNVPKLVELANNLGGNTEYTFITFNVDEIVQKINELDGGNHG